MSSTTLTQAAEMIQMKEVLCLAQDAIHCSSHGRVKLPKHVGLAMCVRHLTGSKQLLF